MADITGRYWTERSLRALAKQVFIEEGGGSGGGISQEILTEKALELYKGYTVVMPGLSPGRSGAGWKFTRLRFVCTEPWQPGTHGSTPPVSYPGGLDSPYYRADCPGQWRMFLELPLDITAKPEDFTGGRQPAYVLFKTAFRFGTGFGESTSLQSLPKLIMPYKSLGVTTYSRVEYQNFKAITGKVPGTIMIAYGTLGVAYRQIPVTLPTHLIDQSTNYGTSFGSDPVVYWLPEKAGDTLRTRGTEYQIQFDLIGKAN